MAEPCFDWQQVRNEFMLRKDRIYLNGGTRSALPRPVFEAQVALMASAEEDPTLVGAARGRQLWPAHERLGAYIGAAPEDFVFQVNVTHAMNLALLSVPWPRDGELLVSDLEYGSIVNACKALCLRVGMAIRRFALPPQPESEEQMIQAVLGALSRQTVGVVVSHVTCGNGLVVPVEKLAPLLRERNVRLIVDGAHAVGLVPVRLGETQIDLCGAQLNKWFMGPRSASFLYAARWVQPVMTPVVVGFGGAPGVERAHHESFAPPGRAFAHMFSLQGTMDWSPILAVIETLKFRERIGEERILARIRELNAYVRRRLGDELGFRCLSPKPEFNAGMVLYDLGRPRHWKPRTDAVGNTLPAQFAEAFGITPAIHFTRDGSLHLRVSTHIWNTESDIDRLADVLRDL